MNVSRWLLFTASTLWLASMGCQSQQGDDEPADPGDNWYADVDGDGFGDPSDVVFTATPSSGYVANNVDCEDTDAEVHPLATEALDTVDNDCDGAIDEGFASDWYVDVDGDGYGDADDSSPTTSVSQPPGTAANNRDCDDGETSINPDATEVSDATDNDCDGDVDEAGSTYYVDCDAATAGTGTIDAPWNDLDGANATLLGPGDRLLLRRDTACVGMLMPQGSGTADDPIVIEAYGGGDGPLPLIDANGAFTAAVHLDDMSHVVVRELELTNPGDISEPHRGVYLTATSTKVTNIEIRDLYIHDVTGPVGFNGTAKRGGGIIGNSLFDTTETQFDGVLIENNLIEDVGRSGIYFDGTSASTGDRPRATESWPAGGQGIVIRGNTLNRLQGDAIVAHGTDSAIIEDNVVRVGNLAGRNWLGEDRNCSAGIWTWNSINTLIQRNEVSHYRFGQSATDGCDGTGFDIDNEQEGTIVQYNYSYNNEGGFILLCSDDEPHGAEVRYNLSIDDGKVINASPCKFPTVGDFSGIRMYNNTFISTNPLTATETLPFTALPSPGDFQFANNIIHATSPQSTLIGCGDRCTHNLFYNLPPVGTDFVVGNPLFEDVSWRGLGRLEAGAAFQIGSGSPALGAGLGLMAPPSADYFGNAIPTPPSIGVHQPE